MNKKNQQSYVDGCKVTNPNDCYFYGCLGVQNGCARLKAIFPVTTNTNQEEK